MSKIKAIRAEADYEAALDRVDELMNAEPGTAYGEELDVLVDLIEHYEAKNIPMGYPSAIEAIRFRMDQAGLTQRDLIPLIGSRSKVSEVLSGKRALTMQMARALHENLGIPADVLLQASNAAVSEPGDVDWERYPVQAMANAGWIPQSDSVKEHAREIVEHLMSRAGESAFQALYRRTKSTRANSKTNPYALQLWRWEVLARSNEEILPANYRPGTVNQAFLGRVAKLSWSENGPRLAKEFLNSHGIHLIALPHLPRTYLDGAAFIRNDGTPVVGLTLRHDRIDNFWFCLIHELAHVGRHVEGESDIEFIDDMSLRKVAGGEGDIRELQADEWAEGALIPGSIWEGSVARRTGRSQDVLNLARTLEIHPAIIAGRIRFERRNYRLLSQFVGSGEVRKHFRGAFPESHEYPS